MWGKMLGSSWIKRKEYKHILYRYKKIFKEKKFNPRGKTTRIPR